MKKRKILDKIKEYYFKKEIVVLIWSRQVWKSSILKIIEKELLKNDYWIFLDADFNSELLFINSSKQLLNLFELNWYKQNSKENFIVFIDEFQKIKNIWTTIKGLYDKFSNIKFFLSWSSSILINKAFWDSMMWRKVVFNIERLDFEEYLSFLWESKLLNIYKNVKIWQSLSIYNHDLLSKIEKFILFWWYPQVVLSDSNEYKIKKIEEIINSYIKKDIQDFFSIEHTTNITKLLKYLTQINTHYFKNSSVSNDIWISSYNLSKYISVLKETFFVKTLEPFYKNKIKTISKTNEIFFSDTWIYNFLIKNYNEIELRIDKWILIENFIYTELWKSKPILDELYFYRDKNQLEVDFLLKKWDILVPIEVKSGSYKKIPANIINFSKKNNLSKAILFNKDIFKIEQKHNIYIYYIPYFLAWRLQDFLKQILSK